MRQQPGSCVTDVSHWCASRRLQLNSDKTEAIWIGSKSAINKLTPQDRLLTVSVSNDTTIDSADVVHDLGVFLDTELSMKQHIAKVAAAFFYHIRRLRQIRRRVGQAVTTRLVLAMITSRLDYYNSVMAGLPQHTLEPLQKVQNSAARFIFNLSRHDHISPSLIQFHWLPVRARIQYKLCSLMYGVHNNRCPSYISDVVQSTKTASTRGRLRSAETTDYSSAAAYQVC